MYQAIDTPEQFYEALQRGAHIEYTGYAQDDLQAGENSNWVTSAWNDHKHLNYTLEFVRDRWADIHPDGVRYRCAKA